MAAALTGRPRTAVITGLTGPPGVGKSTLTTEMVARLRSAGRRVAVLAVDPSSPFSGGALLGDRVRMGEHATDPGVYIRSMSSRGELGGLSAAAPAAADLFSAIGFDDVLVETVGVGQNEIAVMRLADSVVVVLAPGMGDGIQAAKAGILEIADILVVNKSDHDGASGTVRDLKGMVALGRAGAEPHRWRVPVLSTIASKGDRNRRAAGRVGRASAAPGRHWRRGGTAAPAGRGRGAGGRPRTGARGAGLGRRGWNGSPRPPGRSRTVTPTTTGPRSRSWTGSVPVPAGEPLGYRA